LIAGGSPLRDDEEGVDREAQVAGPPLSGMVRAGFDAIWAWLAGTGNGISR